MEVTRCMIRSALARIAGAGAVYILLVKENEPDEVAAFAAEVWRDIVSDAGQTPGRPPSRLCASIVMQTRAKNEHLCVMKLKPTAHPAVDADAGEDNL